MEALNRLIAHTIPLFPKGFVGHLSRHYIAGPSIDDAVRVGRELMREGCCLTMDVLGEHIRSTAEAEPYCRKYLELLDRIAGEGLDANVSIKPTQMGMALDMEACRRNFRRILESARRHGNFVRIDMEDTPYTDLTLDLHEGLVACFPGNVGVVIQAYLRRCMEDVRDRLVPGGANLRICKGIYREPRELAYQGRREIRDSFLELTRELLAAGNYLGIATHDEFLVEGSLRIIDELSLPPERYEFQMLLGVLPGLRREILRRGHRLRVYVPFGEAWFAYSTRRLKENPSLVNHFIKGVFRPH